MVFGGADFELDFPLFDFLIALSFGSIDWIELGYVFIEFHHSIFSGLPSFVRFFVFNRTLGFKLIVGVPFGFTFFGFYRVLLFGKWVTLTLILF